MQGNMMNESNKEITDVSLKKLFRLEYVVLLFLLLSLVACQSEEETTEKEVIRPVKTVNIGAEKKGIIRNFPGKVLPEKEAKLSFEVSDKLIEFPVKEGDKVAEKQLLARLDPRQFQDQVDEEEARFSLSKAQYDRGKKLIKDNHISQSDYDILKSNHQIALASLNSAQHDLDNTYMYAPFSGIIAKKYVENFERVQAKQNILLLHDISHIDIEIYVPEYLLISLQQDTVVNAVVVFESVPGKKFPVKFKEFSSEADPQTQTYSVVFTMKSPEKMNVLPGMSATIKGEIPDYSNEAKSFYLIPSSAVFVDENEQACVWLINSQTQRVELTPVEITRVSGDDIRVIDGLKSGDKIVAAGVHFLQLGEIVKPLE